MRKKIVLAFIATMLASLSACVSYVQTDTTMDQEMISYQGSSTDGLSIMTIKNVDYFLITSASDLKLIGTEPYGLDKHYMQQADIQITEEEWAAFGTSETPFTGSYNGNGFKIDGLTLQTPGTSLFGQASGAELYNITFVNLKADHLADTILENPDSIVCEAIDSCQVYDIFFE